MKPRTIEEWVTYIQTASHRFRKASGQVKVHAKEVKMGHAPRVYTSNMPANPIFILAAITLGLPALALILVVGLNPGIQTGTFMSLLTIIVISAFVVAAVFEIKRLADQSADLDNR
jgi:hypothetical protein